MRHPPMTGLWPLCCAALLTACATEPVERVRFLLPDVPASLRTCAPAPSVPGPNATQRDVARYIVDLHHTGADCREKLGALNSILGRSPL